MPRFSCILATLLTVGVVESFSPIPNLPNLMQSMHNNNMHNISPPSPASVLLHLSSKETTSDPNPTFPSTSKKDDSTQKSETSNPMDDMKDKLVAVINEDNANQILGNVLSGEFGKRGEPYVAAQVFLTLCIVFGGLPVFGNLLNILCGPVLMAIGAGVIALGILDMGASLSPWPVPTGDDLITEGIFSKIRHPIYSGLLALMAGFSVATESAPRLLLTAVLWYALDLKSDYEEEQLETQYAEYKAYRENVPGKFFPQEIIAILPWTNSNDSD